MDFLTHRRLLIFALFAALVLSGAGSLPRLLSEHGNRSVVFGMDFYDVTSLAAEEGITRNEVWKLLSERGVLGIQIKEFTGGELSVLSPMGVKYGSLSSLSGISSGLHEPAALLIPRTSPYVERIWAYLKRKIPNVKREDLGTDILINLPAHTPDMEFSSFLPDFEALDFCLENGTCAIFRPGPCVIADGEHSARAFEYLFSCYPQIKNVTPAGNIITGYPNLVPIAKVMKKYNVSLSQIEFVKQLGASDFAREMYPSLITMHSLTRDEIIMKNMSRRTIVERFIRAVRERSVRLLAVRPYDIYMGGRLGVFLSELDAIGAALKVRGYELRWPEPITLWKTNIWGSLAIGLAFIFCLHFYVMRLKGQEDACVLPIYAVLLIVGALAAGFLMLEIPEAARALGSLCCTVVALEAALSALESDKRPFTGIIVSFFILLSGGLSIASFYGTPMAALRLTPFFGVKLTLLLPPLFLFLHDLRRRIHPESLSEILLRPPLWGELALIGIMLLGLLVMVLRSGNVSSAPGWEIEFRNFMESALLVRPRTKEFLIGYPSLVLYLYFVRNDLWARYREVLRLAAVLAFASAVNTFCHFHTMLIFSLVRVLNGWWLGLLIGLAASLSVAYVVSPFWRRCAREFFN